MSNLTRLQAVSSSLDTAIDKANNLPDAGGSGGGVGTCTITLTASGAYINELIYFDGENAVRETSLSTQSITITAAKNSILYVKRSASTTITNSQNITTVTAGSTEVFFAVDATSDYGSITLTKSSGGPM